MSGKTIFSSPLKSVHNSRILNFSPKLFILLAFAMSGCITLKRPPPAATQAPVCAPEAMAECDTSNPDLPPASELSADFAMDLAKFHQRQRDECAALNRAKAACLRPPALKVKKSN